LKSNTKLSTSMSLTEFDNGYWYAAELKEFAEAIGIPSATRLRKDELEKAIKVHLGTGKIENPTKRNLSTLKRKSGVRYRLNRWREEQLTRGVKLTYEDLVREYVRLNQTKEPFAHIPHGRYINFVSEFMPAEKGATRDQATQAWARLKTLDVPKTYRWWVTSQDAAAQRAVADGRDPRFRSRSRR